MKVVKKLETVGRQTWLAGFGAYDAGREMASEKFDRVFVNSSAFINSLLTKGESLETQLQEKLKVRNMIDEKIAALRAKLGMRSESRDQQLDNLSNKVDELIDVVAKLAHQKTVAKPAAKKAATPKKAVAKKPTAKAAAKPAAKAAAKPAAKAAAKPAAKAATKPAAKAAAKPAAKAAAKPAAKAAAKPAAKAATKTEAKPVAKPTAKLATKAVAKPTGTKAASVPVEENKKD